jgi:hypothetical protein
MEISTDGDGAWRERYSVARAQIAEDGTSDLVGLLQTLCRTLTVNLALLGAAVNLMSATGSNGVAAASDEKCKALDELQFTTNEGPCHDAYADRRPVMTPDLRSVPGGRWPGYATASLDAGVRGVFAFPLQIGAARLGVLDVFAEEAGSLSDEQVAIALTFAQIATEILLDGDLITPAGELEPGLATALDYRSEIYQAQGMVMVDLGVDLAEALARMRAHAFSHGIALIDLARDIIDGYVLGEDDGEEKDR